MSILTGLEFKLKYPNYKAVKIIGNNRNNYHYHLGLNTDSIPFQPNGNCQPGGLYFTDEQYLHYFMNGNYGDQIAFIDIVDNCTIYLEGDY